MRNSDLRDENSDVAGSLDLAVRIVLSEARKHTVYGGEWVDQSDDGRQNTTRPYDADTRRRICMAIKMVEDFFKSRPTDRERYVTED